GFACLDGDRALISAGGSSVGPGSYGGVFVYHFDGRNWVHQQTLLPHYDPAWSAFFHAADLDGRVALISAAGEAMQSGSAYVYTLDPVPADLNCDGRISGVDLAMMLASWGSQQQRGVSPSPADLNGDGLVNGLDVGMLLAAWGS